MGGGPKTAGDMAEESKRSTLPQLPPEAPYSRKKHQSKKFVAQQVQHHRGSMGLSEVETAEQVPLSSGAGASNYNYDLN